MNREIEADLLPLCEREQVSVLPYYGLANGYLTGKYRTAEDKAKSLRGGRMDKYMEAKGPAVLAVLDAMRPPGRYGALECDGRTSGARVGYGQVQRRRADCVGDERGAAE